MHSMHSAVGRALAPSAYGGSNWFQRTFDPTGVEMNFNSYQASLERAFNAEQAQLNRAFQERMSNTAYQRGVDDMRKAGLNPYAVYGGASPASVPVGSSASSGGGARISGGANSAIIGQIANVALSAFSIGTKFNLQSKWANASNWNAQANYLRAWTSAYR